MTRRKTGLNENQPGKLTVNQRFIGEAQPTVKLKGPITAARGVVHRVGALFRDRLGDHDPHCRRRDFLEAGLDDPSPRMACPSEMGGLAETHALLLCPVVTTKEKVAQALGIATHNIRASGDEVQRHTSLPSCSRRPSGLKWDRN